MARHEGYVPHMGRRKHGDEYIGKVHVNIFLFFLYLFSNDHKSLPNRVDYLFELIVVNIEIEWD